MPLYTKTRLWQTTTTATKHILYYRLQCALKCLLQAWSHTCCTIFLSHSFRLRLQNQSHFNRITCYTCKHNRNVFKLCHYGGLQKDEQKCLVNSLWARNTNTLRKHLWFVHPSVNLTFSVIFIFPFPGQTRWEQVLHVLKICHHIPQLNNTCFWKLLILAFIPMASFCGGGGGPGAINSLFLTLLQLFLWRIDVRNSNWRLESGSG